MNAGVVVYCQALDFLGIKVQLVTNGTLVKREKIEFLSQLDIIIDLAIIRNDRAIRAPHRLRAIGRQVDDGETAMDEADATVRRHPLAIAVGSAMDDQR